MAAVSDARKKDRGWDPAVVTMLLDGLDVDVAPDWLLQDLPSENLRRFVRNLRLPIAKIALPPEG
jgi:hypothetical protein